MFKRPQATTMSDGLRPALRPFRTIGAASEVFSVQPQPKAARKRRPFQLACVGFHPYV